MDIYYNALADKQEIIEWLEETVPHVDTSPGRHTGYGDRCVVYGVYSSVNRVYIRDEKYATMFILRWS
jgi:hypothetical protein